MTTATGASCLLNASRFAVPYFESNSSRSKVSLWLPAIATATFRYTGLTPDVNNTRLDFAVRFDLTAISAASASADAPSYTDALLASRPVRPVIIVWYS